MSDCLVQVLRLSASFIEFKRGLSGQKQAPALHRPVSPLSVDETEILDDSHPSITGGARVSQQSRKGIARLVKGGEFRRRRGSIETDDAQREGCAEADFSYDAQYGHGRPAFIRAIAGVSRLLRVVPDAALEGRSAGTHALGYSHGAHSRPPTVESDLDGSQ